MNKILFFILMLTGCNGDNFLSNPDRTIVTYGYEKESNCINADCALSNTAKIILNVNPSHQVITFKLIAKITDWEVTSYESLKNCKVVSKKDFQCDELYSDDGKIFGSTSRYDMKTSSISKKEGTFSKYEVISGSEIVYYTSKLVNLSKKNIELIDKYGIYILIVLILGIIGNIDA